MRARHNMKEVDTPTQAINNDDQGKVINSIYVLMKYKGIYYTIKTCNTDNNEVIFEEDINEDEYMFIGQGMLNRI